MLCCNTHDTPKGEPIDYSGLVCVANKQKFTMNDINVYSIKYVMLVHTLNENIINKFMIIVSLYML